ncbi:hypothetical protein [Clostridium sp. C2-6-12]|uniref:hypothetical protein n=1 Tax=Clostridium sp. C2-6-12 TaxID=2698832 RepID=UPI001FACF954|nr:hypothetical protein [Clostridium sp. C2-6-12]
MNGQIKKYIYIIGTICVLVLAGVIFVKILPFLILAGIVGYGIVKITSFIRSKKANDTISNSEFKNQYDNEDTFENGSESYTNGDIIDVDYEEVDKDK